VRKQILSARLIVLDDNPATRLLCCIAAGRLSYTRDTPALPAPCAKTTPRS